MALLLIAVVVLLSLETPWAATGLEIADTVFRWVMYAGVLSACGGVVFLCFAHDRSPDPHELATAKWVVQVAAAVGVLATLVGLAIHAATIAGVGAAGLVDHHAIGSAAHGSAGASAVVRLLGLVYVTYAVVRLWEPSAMVLALTGAALTLGSFLVVGHTATTEPRALVLGSDIVHTFAAATWLGGLVLLGVTLRARARAGDAAGGARIVGRFSTMAAGSLVGVTAAGLGLAWAEVRSLEGLVTTTYGWTLVAKLAVVATVVLVAGYNNRRLVPAVGRGDTDAWRRLAATVRAEVLGLLVVLLITAVLVNLVPPRTELL